MDNKRMNTFFTCVTHLSERLRLCCLYSVRLIIQDLEEILDLQEPILWQICTMNSILNLGFTKNCPEGLRS